MGGLLDGLELAGSLLVSEGCVVHTVNFSLTGAGGLLMGIIVRGPVGRGDS
jgi:hypothetical protein